MSVTNNPQSGQISIGWRLRTDKHLVYENIRQKVYRIVTQVDSQIKEYFVNDTGVKAGMVALQEDKVLMVQQYRLLVDKLTWEIPGGCVDEDETPDTAAVRECLEETGVRCLNPKLLIYYHSGLETSYNPTHIFYSDELAEQKAELIHKNEIHSQAWIPLSTCLEMIRRSEIQDSFSILALLSFWTSMSQYAGEHKTG